MTDQPQPTYYAQPQATAPVEATAATPAYLPPPQPAVVYQQLPPPQAPMGYQQPATVVQVPQQPFKWPATPVAMTCPHCNQAMQTQVVEKSGAAVFVTIAVLCILGWWPCSLIPLCVHEIKDIEHSCPHCHAALGKFDRLQNGFK